MKRRLWVKRPLAADGSRIVSAKPRRFEARTKLFKSLAILIALLACLTCLDTRVAVATSQPAARTSDAQATVAALIELIRGLGAAKDQAERTQIIQSIDDSLAIESMARRALAQTWLKLSKPQRNEFVDLMTKTLEKLAYPRAADFFTGLIVDYQGVSAITQGEIVRTRVTRALSGQVSIDYLMEQNRGRWRVKDVNLDGASLAESVTNQIQAVLKQSSYAALIGKIRARLAEASSASQSADLIELCINCR